LTRKQLKEDRFLRAVQVSLAYARDNVAVVVLGAVGFILLVTLAVRIAGSAAGLDRGSRVNVEAQRALVAARDELALARLESGAAALEEVRRRHERSEAAREATFILANTYYESGDYERARETYEAFLANPLHDDLLRDGARLGIACSREEMGDLSGALTEYQAVWTDGEQPASRADAALGAARCARAQNRPEEARGFYQAVIDTFPSSPEAAEARFQLLQLGLPEPPALPGS
jgi:outer membrane protein assembly factor BamD (BamD/ComL family)